MRTLEGDLRRAKSECEKLRSQLAEAKEAAMAEGGGDGSEVSRLRSKIAELEALVQRHKKDLLEDEKHCDNYLDRITELEKGNEALRKTLEAKASSLTDMRRQSEAFGLNEFRLKEKNSKLEEVRICCFKLK